MYVNQATHGPVEGTRLAGATYVVLPCVRPARRRRRNGAGDHGRIPLAVCVTRGFVPRRFSIGAVWVNAE